MLTGRNIVCFSTEEWDTQLPTNKRHLMERLGANNRILFVETLGTRFPKLALKDIKRMFRRVRHSRLESHASQHVTVFSPRAIPSYRNNVLIALNRILLVPHLLRALELTHMHSHIAWVYNPYAAYLLDDLQPELVLYHCVDDLALVPGANRNALRKAERLLLEKANLVVASTETLFEKCKTHNPDTHLLHNVADFSHFNTADLPETPLAPEIERLPQPRIIFSGNLAPHKVDFELIVKVARAFPEASVVLIGPVWEGKQIPQLKTMQSLENVSFFGHKPYESLPNYLKGADTLIIPYLLNEVTAAVFPLKFFEYLATGKPVVTTALPSLKRYTDVVSIADSHEDFLNALKETLNKDTQEAKHERLRVARENTWENNIDNLSRLVESKLKRVTP